MRYSLLALAATTLLSSASARGHAHRRHAHAHAELQPASANDECVCSTYVTSYLVDYTPAPVPPVGVDATTTLHSYMTVVPIVETPSAEIPTPEEEITTTVSSTWTSTEHSTAVVTVSAELPKVSHPVVPVPTPVVTTIETPGTYTIPATTITLTKTEAVCVPETTSLAPGTQTYGGVTTIVATSTTVVCPLATVTVEDGVTTSKVYTTTYICPSAGTYIIGATTSTVTGTVTVPCEYPVPTAYPPGTYTQPEFVTTITVTKQVITCPLFTAGPTSEPTTAPVVVPTPSAAVPTPSVAVPTTSAAVPTAPVVSTVAPSAPSSPAVVPTAAPSTPVSSKVIPVVSTVSSAVPVHSAPVSVPGGGPWAITYSPYSDTGGCKGGPEVDSDIAQIASKGFQNIRLYSTDCDGLQTVGGAAEKHGLGIIMGIFIKAGGVSTGDSQVQDLLTWNKWHMVVMFVIGNEAVFNGYCSASELSAYIAIVSGKARAAGYNGPITTTEPLNIIQANAGALCRGLDVIGVNIHPYFNSGVTADKAGEFLAGQLKLAEEACGLDGWVLEAGWPSDGNVNGVAIPGKAEQATAIAAIAKAVPGKITFFTFTNDGWKDPGPFAVERNFGCGGLF